MFNPIETVKRKRLDCNKRVLLCEVHACLFFLFCFVIILMTLGYIHRAFYV